MKIIFQDESNLILFLNKLVLKSIDFTDQKQLEEHFRNLFLKLKEDYDIEISGYYTIDLYIDQYYGVIIEMQNEELDYFEYDDNQVDMKICIHETSILYRLEEYIDLDVNLYDIIFYHNKWYVKLKDKIDDISLGKLLEYADICYQKELDYIMKNGIYVKKT